MKARIAVMLLSLAVCSVPGRTQTPAPSITIGTHVLTLGMQESNLLEQLGSDLTLTRGIPGVWTISKSAVDVKAPIGSVSFDKTHHLSGATRYWILDHGSSRSVFYALNAATEDLEYGGLVDCHLSTGNKDYSTDGANMHFKEIRFDCGAKMITLDFITSDTQVTRPEVQVTEFLRRR
ncbi:MAG: hypothetical protein WB524_11815 [Acidobacteriaceae bacterium]